ncbi:MAG: hypothetical protein AAF235_05465 [Planctomycetota bacterium]
MSDATHPHPTPRPKPNPNETLLEIRDELRILNANFAEMDTDRRAYNAKLFEGLRVRLAEIAGGTSTRFSLGRVIVATLLIGVILFVALLMLFS